MAHEHGQDIDEDFNFEFLELEEFATGPLWLEAINRGVPDAYVYLEHKYLGNAEALEPEHMVFMSLLSRARGVHEAIVKAIELQNPHGTFPLIRVFMEIACILRYANERSDFVKILFNSDGTRGGIPKFVIILDSVETTLPYSKDIYFQLSEYTHFKGIGIFNNFNITVTQNLPQLLWTSKPRFRSDKDFRTACALTKRIFDQIVVNPDNFGETYLVQSR